MKRMTKSRLFFLELVLDLIFFFLCAAICVTLFARSGDLTRGSSELNAAMTLAESVAETFRAGDGDMDMLDNAFALDVEQSLHRAFYDANWQPTTEEQCAYQMDILPTGADDLMSIDIEIFCAGENSSIYHLKTSVYTGEVLS